MGYIRGKQCIVVNDATVKAGMVPSQPRKNLRAQEIAMENRLPILFVDSAGAFTCLYRTKFSQTKNILVVFLEIMHI
jgi:acetyl-CoA carboxylase carboxyltransferase component